MVTIWGVSNSKVKVHDGDPDPSNETTWELLGYPLCKSLSIKFDKAPKLEFVVSLYKSLGLPIVNAAVPPAPASACSWVKDVIAPEPNSFTDRIVGTVALLSLVLLDLPI